MQPRTSLPEVAAGCVFGVFCPVLLRPFLWVIELMDVMSMVPVEEVGVYIERDANATVPELLLDVFGICSLLNQETGERMPEVMEADVPQSCRCETGLEGVAHEFVPHPLVRGSGEDPGRQLTSLHGRVQRPHLFQALKDLGQCQGTS
jgi:hypothetical protein